MYLFSVSVSLFFSVSSYSSSFFFFFCYLHLYFPLILTKRDPFIFLVLFSFLLLLSLFNKSPRYGSIDSAWRFAVRHLVRIACSPRAGNGVSRFHKNTKLIGVLGAVHRMGFVFFFASRKWKTRQKKK